MNKGERLGKEFANIGLKWRKKQGRNGARMIVNTAECGSWRILTNLLKSYHVESSVSCVSVGVPTQEHTDSVLQLLKKQLQLQLLHLWIGHHQLHWTERHHRISRVVEGKSALGDQEWWESWSGKVNNWKERKKKWNIWKLLLPACQERETDNKAWPGWGVWIIT